jgi:hypothetical protein
VSAGLVFIGLRMSFDTGGLTFQTGALMLALLGYTLLLATTACVLIRIGNVWDDVRTILLLVVAMFLAMSITFDETLASNPSLGQAFYVGGFLFAVGLTECVLRGIQLRLPALFRVPYYLILGLFFLYPIALSPLVKYPETPPLQWMLFGFTPIAGLVFLSLLSAIRKGPDYVSKNGSPWRYPLYPWVLFGLLALAVCGRAYYLCISLHFVERSSLVGKSDTIFGWYFLIPFLLALGILKLQAALKTGSKTGIKTAMLLPAFLVVLAMVGHRPDPVYQGFLQMFRTDLGGTPLYLTLLALVAFYGLAAIARIPLGLAGLTCSLLGLAVVGPNTMDLDGLVAPRSLPLLALALLEFGLAWNRPNSWRCAFGSLCLIGSIAGLLDGVRLGGYELVAIFHLALLASIGIGWYFEDSLGQLLKCVSAVMLVLACLGVSWEGERIDPRIPPVLIQLYSLVMLAICLGLSCLSDSYPYRVALGTCLAGWLLVAGWERYLILRTRIVGLDWISGGLAFFAIAMVISLGKAGFWSRWIERRATRTAAP